MKEKIVLLIVSIAILTSCRVSKSDGLLIGSLEKLGCYGKCPEYKVEVYRNGSVIFYGKQHVSMIGKATFNLNKVEFKELKKAFAKVDWEEINSAYLLEAPDLMKTRIINGSGREVLFHKRKAPEEVLQLLEKIEGVLDSYVTNN